MVAPSEQEEQAHEKASHAPVKLPKVSLLCLIEITLIKYDFQDG